MKKQKEYEMLSHKYNNLKRSIENQQTMESQLFEKSVRTNRDLNRTTTSSFIKKSSVSKQEIL